MINNHAISFIYFDFVIIFSLIRQRYIDCQIIFIEKMIEILKNRKFRLIQKFKKSKILQYIIS